MSKSILGTSLQVAFTLAAYVMYIFAVYNQSSNWIYITALIYFFPIFVGYADSIQGIKMKYKWLFVLSIILIFISVLYIAFLLLYLNLNMQNMNTSMASVFQVIIVVVPVVCIPMRAFPLAEAIMQYHSRSFSK